MQISKEAALKTTQYIQSKRSEALDLSLITWAVVGRISLFVGVLAAIAYLVK